MWFVHPHFQINLEDVTKIFIDATYNTAKDNIHLYSILGEETSYRVPLAFMIIEVRKKEDTRQQRGMKEMLQCNKSFYSQAKALGLYPRFVHTDKDWSELSASMVRLPGCTQGLIAESQCLARSTQQFMCVAH